MCERDDELFIELLNSIRIDIVNKGTEALLKSQFTRKSNDQYAIRALHICIKWLSQ